MQIQVGEQSYHIHVHHHFLTEEERAEKLWDIVTTAQVHTGPCILTTGEHKYCINGEVGTSRCSKKDKFVKRVGAKLALKDALAGTQLSKDVREAIWNEIWLRMRRPKERLDKFRRRIGRTGTIASTAASAPAAQAQV